MAPNATLSDTAPAVLSADLLPAALGRWGHGQLIAFSALDGPTAIATDLIARTVSDAAGDGLDVVMPGTVRLRFAQRVVDASLSGDWFSLRLADGATVRGALLDHRHLLIQGPVSLAGTAPELGIRLAGDRILIGAAAGFTASLITTDLPAAMRQRAAWLERMLARLPAAVAQRPVAAKVLAMMKTQVCAPEGVFTSRWTTPDRWPHRYAYLWDSAFHALAWRHLDPALALEQLGALLQAQAAEGFLPHRLTPDGGTDITQPPILAWGAAQVLALAPDNAWLAWAYPRLTRFLDWVVATRTVEHGLLAWQTTAIDTCRCDESGWDNSPRFDRNPSPLAVDLNAFLVREFQVMAGFARTLGRNAEAEQWASRATQLTAAIDTRLWDEQRGLYADRAPGAAQVAPLRTPAGLLPLISGGVSSARGSRMAALLADPQVFGTAIPLPSVAAADLAGLSSVGDMWRGPVWININHQIVRGLQASGQREAAARLRTATLAAIERWYEKTGGIFEFYDPFDRLAPAAMPRKGYNDPSSPYHQVIHDFGWTASCWLDLACAPEG